MVGRIIPVNYPLDFVNMLSTWKLRSLMELN